MSKFAEPMTRLIDELKKLPGIGSKTAQRLAFHILRSSDSDAEALATAVRDVKAKLRLCSICNNITDVDPCVYCSNPTRNQRLVCVVEEPTNIAAIEKTRHFNGSYHGGLPHRPTQASWPESEKDCHGHPGRQRYRVRRRNHHAESHRRPPRIVDLSWGQPRSAVRSSKARLSYPLQALAALLPALLPSKVSLTRISAPVRSQKREPPCRPLSFGA